ncbi:hypothetical protein AURDEDRAFT_176272 [Auricularia subglabra TFB-10046 SS5]|uniref:Uncharacterized protein n=1 Tax=Auricularia subglabra (strain TFB-10046 / SS5) TaxID=717982 RepID=J0WQA9_AURST|nr:hypothetical protein AURDEDRAFT_176272 [Auricularia subglabra TFB-10046 SS5]
MSFRVNYPESNLRTDLPPPARPASPPFPYHLAIPAPAPGYITAQAQQAARDAEERARRYGPVPPKMVVPPHPGGVVPPTPATPSARPPPRPHFAVPLAAPMPIPTHPLYTADFQCPFAQCGAHGKNLVCGTEKALKDHLWRVHGMY